MPPCRQWLTPPGAGEASSRLAPPAWLLHEVGVYLYQRINASWPCYVPNRGFESAIYLRFIADHYKALPALESINRRDLPVYISTPVRTITSGPHSFSTPVRITNRKCGILNGQTHSKPIMNE